MSDAYIPKALRETVVAQAHHRCGYCLTSEAIVGTPMEIDHLIPQSLGGLTDEDNLWLARSAMITKATGSPRLIRSQMKLCGSLIRATRYGGNTLRGQPRGIGSMA